MPQLEFSTYFTQFFWLLVTFIIFWLIMAKMIVPRIAEMVEARKRKYNDYVIKAEEMNKKALETLKQYEEVLAAAKAKAAEQIAENEQNLKRIIVENEQDINKKLEQKISENEKCLAKEISETMKQADKLALNTTEILLPHLNLLSITRKDIEEVFMETSKHGN